MSNIRCNICINALIGLPASGKSTFSRKIQSETKHFNIIHICYDDFIQMPTTENSSSENIVYFQSKQYKKQRFSLIWLIQQMIEDIKEKRDFVKFRQVMRSDFPHVQFHLGVFSTKKPYLLLLDDTMHYKSMRKQIRTLARNHEIGYFVSYFSTSLETSIKRNRNRGLTVDENQIQRMFDIFEPPSIHEDGEILTINTDNSNGITTQSVELIALKCIDSPLRIVPTVDNPVIEQTIIHKVDLILRKSINVRMKNSKFAKETSDLSTLANVLCVKRLFILNEIKLGRIDLPENLDDLSVFV